MAIIREKDLVHGEWKKHKYIRKYKSKKSGNWVYVYPAAQKSRYRTNNPYGVYGYRQSLKNRGRFGGEIPTTFDPSFIPVVGDRNSWYAPRYNKSFEGRNEREAREKAWEYANSFEYKLDQAYNAVANNVTRPAAKAVQKAISVADQSASEFIKKGKQLLEGLFD